jgi:hypothetical protein
LLLETAHTASCNSGDLQAAWLEFIHTCQEGHFPKFSQDDIQEFSSRIENLGYPAMHHSEIYSQEYMPAYRLIADRFIPQLGLAVKVNSGVKLLINRSGWIRNRIESMRLVSYHR